MYFRNTQKGFILIAAVVVLLIIAIVVLAFLAFCWFWNKILPEDTSAAIYFLLKVMGV